MLTMNIDPIRAEIMRLENAQFDRQAWERVLAILRAGGRLAGLADAQRRMDTTACRQAVVVETEE